MINLLDISKDITFREDIHEYRNKEGKVLTSVSQLLSLYKEKFDSTGIIAYKCGQKEGISKEAMQARWREKNEKACLYGHNIHASVEYFLKNGQIQDDINKDIVEDFSKIKFKGKIHSELRLKSDKYSLAGTCDIARLAKNKVFIDDIKSNERFDLESKYNKKLLYPLKHIPDCHHYTYSLQILIYGEMIKEHGFDFEPGHLLWINPKTRKFEKYNVLDLNKEVNILLEHYKKMQEW